MARLQGGDVGVFLVGDEGGVAVAGLVVKDREWGAGTGSLVLRNRLGAVTYINRLFTLRDEIGGSSLVIVRN